MPQPQPDAALGLSILKVAPIRSSSKEIVAPSRKGIEMLSVMTAFQKSGLYRFCLPSGQVCIESLSSRRLLRGRVA